MRQTTVILGGLWMLFLASCGGGDDTSKVKEALRFKDYQFFWTEGAKIDLPELPAESVVEIHPTYIIVDAKDGWRILIPMDRIRLINLKTRM